MCQFLLAKEEAHCLYSPQRKWILFLLRQRLGYNRKLLPKNFRYLEGSSSFTFYEHVYISKEILQPFSFLVKGSNQMLNFWYKMILDGYTKKIRLIKRKDVVFNISISAFWNMFVFTLVQSLQDNIAEM